MHLNSHGKLSIAAVLCQLVLLAGILGCRSGRVYTVADMPADLQAIRLPDAQTLDLSRLGGQAASDRIECGDVIEVSIAAALSTEAVITFPVRVDDNGIAILPEVGQLQLAGLSLAGAEQSIAAACGQRGLYRQPKVTVTMRQQRQNRITVVGAVKKPGVHELPRNSSYVVAALASAEGFTDDAGTRLEIRFPKGNTRLASGAAIPPGNSDLQLAANLENVSQPALGYVCLNLTDTIQQGANSHYLPDGSVLMVERRRLPPYQVIGLVKTAGEYEFVPGRDVRVLGAIARAGGVTQALADKVYVIRTKPNGEAGVIEVSLEQAKLHQEQNIRLQPGDVVSVEHNVVTIALESIRQIPFHIGASLPIW